MIILAQILGIILLLVSLYYFGLSFFGIIYRPDTVIRPPTSQFAIMIAAHNEEAVVGALIENLKHLDYPRDMYDIIVIADNCSDQTAENAFKAGAKVWVRNNTKELGKGYALEYAFERLKSLPRNYDAVVVIDADNLVALDFLKIMNNHLQKGEQIIQAYLDTKNASDTWITRSIHIGYVITNRFWQLAKYNLGFSCALGGTGMCIRTDLLFKFGWGVNSLTEDLEFQIKALLHGIKVNWANDTRVYDEKPLTLRQSWQQRKRWMQGHFTLAKRYLIPLVMQGIKKRDFACIDTAIYCCNPFFIMFSGIGILLQIMMGFPTLHSEYILISSFGFLGQFLYFALPVVLEHNRPSIYWWILYFPFFALTWIPVAFVGFFTQSNRQWNHTLHTRKISFQELDATSLLSNQVKEIAEYVNPVSNLKFEEEAPLLLEKSRS